MDFGERIQRYAQRFDVTVGSTLGSGHHGSVFVARSNSNKARFAVKFCRDEPPYVRECRAYRILKERGVFDIEGFSIPQFLGSDEEFLAIQMTIVEPPFLLDFGSAYSRQSLPEFSEGIWAEWREQKQQEFEERWPLVENALMVLRSFDIFMLDIHARNIVFRDRR